MRSPPPPISCDLHTNSGALIFLSMLALLSCRGAGSCCPRIGDPSPSSPSLVALFSRNTPVLDGKLRDRDWTTTGVTQPFVDVSEPAAVVAHTEARALWDGQGLYLVLFAADEDIQSRDTMALEIRLPDESSRVLRLEFSPSSRKSCRFSDTGDCDETEGIRWAVSLDETLDDPSDDDEEWIVEVFIPWKALGLADPPQELALRLQRQDQPKGGRERILSWGFAPGRPELFGRVSLSPKSY